MVYLFPLCYAGGAVQSTWSAGHDLAIFQRNHGSSRLAAKKEVPPNG